MSNSSVRQAHNLLNGAFTRAVRWRWIGSNPVRQAEPPPPARTDPQPPSPEQAAKIATAAWTEPGWGMLVWLAMTTGPRRGELCALRWKDIDFAAAVIDISASIGQLGTKVWEKDTKTHQRRRIVFDPQTRALLRAYVRQRAQLCVLAETVLDGEAFVFGPDVDGHSPIKPDTVTQRYRRMCKRLGWDMHIHQLRHFSATELVAAGVDIRTVAWPTRPWRRGHDDSPRVQRMGCRGRPASRRISDFSDASTARPRLDGIRREPGDAGTPHTPTPTPRIGELQMICSARSGAGHCVQETACRR